MATLKDIQHKIGAVKKTKQITRAMNMVAAARLKNVQGKTESFAPYAVKFAEMLGNLAGHMEPGIHPLLMAREDVRNVELLHFTADRGLCGSFNTNLINRAEKWINERRREGKNCSLTIVGKKSRDYFRKRDVEVTDTHVGVYGSVDVSFVNRMTGGFIDRFVSGRVDEVYAMYTRFVSMSRQEPTLVKLIPIEPPPAAEAPSGTDEIEYIFEPGPEELLVELLPKHINVQIINAFLQNETSEHASRMAAMDNASRNCGELIDNLTLAFNKARQAAITAELMDIVGGAEALRGS
jgi:F-type H+-transporting ATPase subunit gamma